MAIKALNPFAPFWHTPPGQENEPDPTRFKICGLDGEQIGDIASEMRVDAQGRFAGYTGRGVALILSGGLKDWENFSNDAGPVAFGAHNFRLIPYPVRTGLALEIVAASHVPEDARKNS